MKPMMKNTELISQAELYPKSAFPPKRALAQCLTWSDFKPFDKY